MQRINNQHDGQTKQQTILHMHTHTQQAQNAAEAAN
jgi:hypothetical protein